MLSQDKTQNFRRKYSLNTQTEFLYFKIQCEIYEARHPIYRRGALMGKSKRRKERGEAMGG